MTLVTIISVLISLLAAGLFLLLFWDGINASNLENNLKIIYKKSLWVGICIWVAIIYILTLTDTFTYRPDVWFPKFLIGLFVPVFIVLSLFINKHFKAILDNLSFKNLALGQLWRLLGAVFFLVAIWEMGPKAFLASGYGDVLTGIIALVTLILVRNNLKQARLSSWVLTLVGTTDLLIVLYILLSYHPIWYDGLPNTAMAGSFPMMLIIGIAAPIALIQHIITLRKLLLNTK
ncbi:hypothetical protein [Aestuariivivens sp. NBU2969]|uniref:hypothetical protein n=1 Tax=Aestuariivivens sp. NBU2969 TaxID=2873267 RepID=UPI001CBCA495|nr:hypothetical protein [Aestuariivivens sp. NBU2969]